ncbi:hypothetical protein E8E13_000994 [Curvularia kusanoi]|uniref:Uncharacterized protein n=1 Tax=Curvularia kusanoi TaxID=90978 RepID=A0A9P4T9Z0_CURKU|nr:hypothetical protein E8E13_000994 [Curvularia kusanoi]
MTTDIWQLADVEEQKFAAAAALLATHTKGRSVRRPTSVLSDGEDDDSDEEVSDDEGQTTMACEKLHRANSNALKDRFLDRLSELFAREKASISSPKHVASAAWIDSSSGIPLVLINELKLDADESPKGQIQRLLRLCGTYEGNPSDSTLEEVVELAFELRSFDWRQYNTPSLVKIYKNTLMLGRLRAAYEYFKTIALSFPGVASIKLKPLEPPQSVGIETNRFWP